MSTISTDRKPTICDSTKEELLGIILLYLSRFDDYIQDAADKGIDNSEFESSYHDLEAHYHLIKSGQEPNRISIIGLIKHTYRLACTEIYWS